MDIWIAALPVIVVSLLLMAFGFGGGRRQIIAGVLIGLVLGSLMMAILR